MNFTAEISDADIERIAARVAEKLAALSKAPDYEPMADACKRLFCTERHARRLVSSGHLKATHIGRRVLVLRSSVDLLLAQGSGASSDRGAHG